MELGRSCLDAFSLGFCSLLDSRGQFVCLFSWLLVCSQTSASFTILLSTCLRHCTWLECCLESTCLYAARDMSKSNREDSPKGEHGRPNQRSRYRADGARRRTPGEIKKRAPYVQFLLVFHPFFFTSYSHANLPRYGSGCLGRDGPADSW